MAEDMIFWNSLDILFAIIGVATIAFLHLVIPICFSRPSKIRSTSSMWWIAAAGGLLGYVLCSILTEGDYTGLGSFFWSGFFTLVGYTILHRKRTKLIMAELIRIEEEKRARNRWFGFWRRRG